MFEQEAYPTGPRPRCPRAPVLDGDRTRRSTRSMNRGPPSVCRSTRGNRRRPVMGSSSAMVGPVGCGSLAKSWPPGERVGAANLIPPARDRRLTGTGRAQASCVPSLDVPELQTSPDARRGLLRHDPSCDLGAEAAWTAAWTQQACSPSDSPPTGVSPAPRSPISRPEGNLARQHVLTWRSGHRSSGGLTARVSAVIADDGKRGWGPGPS